MFAADYRKLKVEDLEKEIQKKREEIMGVQEGIMRGTETNVRKSLKLRRELAKMLTVLTEIKNKK